MIVQMTKCHGSGNDFFILDEQILADSLTDQTRADLARAFCNRKSELGADGILFVQESSIADAKMRVFNADGSEASMCGNGLRCVARYVCEKLGVQKAVVETMKVNLQVELREEIYPGIPTYRVEISPISFKVEDLPLKIEGEQLINELLPQLSEELHFTALAVPNPHLITIVDNNEDLRSNLQKELSERVNGKNELFPDGVNVSFVKPLKKGHIYVRTFERGVGFTNACGTAMSASTLVTCLVGLNAREEAIEVYNNGGKVRCVVHEDHIDLIGNASYVYHCKVEVHNGDFQTLTVVEKSECTQEIAQYEKLGIEAKALLSEYL